MGAAMRDHDARTHENNLPCLATSRILVKIVRGLGLR